jgi:hypothetical protein
LPCNERENARERAEIQAGGVEKPIPIGETK